MPRRYVLFFLGVALGLMVMVFHWVIGGGSGAADPGCVEHAGNPLIQFPLSVTSVNLEGSVHGIEDLPIIKYLLPSIIETVEPKVARYWIAVAADSDDPWYDNAAAQAQIAAWFASEWARRWAHDGNYCAPRLTFNVYDNTHSCNVRAVNYVSVRGYMEGADYFYRVNDDSILHKSNWSSLFIAALAAMRPIPNLGVVGPVDAFQNDVFLTHSMVHRVHFRLFTLHFSALFCNWWSDNWIQFVYTGPYPSTFGENATMFAILKETRVTHKILPSRYTVKSTDKQYQAQLLIDREERNTLVPKWAAELS
jgi:hypothetical protein